ncbi:hypothetical protein [Bosea lathyri]|uniref:hypothetical protein n=1 Tax=Bosea lathyri TaxID=1036778 RepID=UPI0011B0CE4E|nr:hypothetical protein [Bosea lathyri]
MLIQATDGHINRGGEFEQRAAFVGTYSLPPGTVALAFTPTSIVVFGHEAGIAVPSGVTYQRLVHPSGLALIDVPSFDLYKGLIYAVGVFSDGSRHHYYDGTRVTDWYDGRARASFVVTAGTVSPQSKLTDLNVGGVSVIGAPVNWITSNSVTAANIATAVNSASSSPEYTAVSDGDTVFVIAATSGAAENGKPVTFTLTDGLGVSPASTSMMGGADVPGTYPPGLFARTIGSKMYSTSGPNMHFSGIQQPTRWNGVVGSGFIDMSSESSGSEELIALAKYQNYVAVFAESVVQIWFVDPDPTLNKIAQVLNNTGTVSPRSVTQFGDSDLFYLNESGLRSLRARDASNAAATTDIGVPVDDLVVEALQALGDDNRDEVIGLIEPRSGRFWLIIRGQIFVFSFFSGAKVSAWSRYLPGFDISHAVVFKKRVYVRSGNSIYAYGGIGSATVYDDTQAIAQLPYLDGGAPAKEKTLSGMDASARGTWQVSVALEPLRPDGVDVVGTIHDSTFTQATHPVEGKSTHISLIFKSVGLGPHKLGSAVIHYDGDADED